MKKLFLSFLMISLIGLFSCDKDEIVTPQEEDVRVGEGDLSSGAQLKSVSYDYNGAASYALTYTNTNFSTFYDTSPYNSNYLSFNPADCANFVSQCLYEGGGIPMSTSSDWYYDNNGTPANTGDDLCGDAWTDVDLLMDYMLNATSKSVVNFDPANMTTYYNLRDVIRKGDVLFFDYNEDNDYTHVEIISGHNGTDPLVSAHTYNEMNQNMKNELLGMGGIGTVKLVRINYY